MSLPIPTRMPARDDGVVLWEYDFPEQSVTITAPDQQTADVAMQAVLDAQAVTAAATTAATAVAANNPWPLTFTDPGQVTFFPPVGHYGFWICEIALDKGDIIGAGNAVFGINVEGANWCDVGTSFIAAADTSHGLALQFVPVADGDGNPVVGPGAAILVSTAGSSGRTVTVSWRRLSTAPW